MPSLSLKQKLIALSLLSGIVPIIVVGTIILNRTTSALEQAEFDKLKAINELKKVHLDDYYKTMEGKIHVVKDNPFVAKALGELDGAFMKAGDSIDSDEWRALASQYDPVFEDMRIDLGLEDLVLMCPEGIIVYTTKKKGDLGLFVNKEPLNSTSFGEAFATLDADKSLEVAYGDYKPYAPAKNTPTGFMVARIPGETPDEPLGHIGFSLPFESLDSIMQEREGMGETGESYLVGKDHLMRSNSYLNPTDYSVAASFKNGNKIETEAVFRAFKGEDSFDMILDYNGNSVLSVFHLVNMGPDIQWAMISEIGEAEAFATVKAQQIFIATAAFIVIIIIGTVSYITSSKLAKTILSYTEDLSKIAGNVASASGELSSMSQDLTSATTEQASSIEETSASLEEMSGMIDSNVENARNSEKFSSTTAGVAKEANGTMNNLKKSMDDVLTSNEKIKQLVSVIQNIGEKTKVMDEIVFQTKLLSFNASVEAERAGEHGRGFAVVAQEVGNLAHMSGKSAREISEIVKSSILEAEAITKDNKEKVETGSSYVSEAATALVEIASQSEKSAGSVKHVLTASEDQSVGIKAISTAMQQLDKATQEIAASSEESAASSEELNAQASSLRDVADLMNTLVTAKAQVSTI